MISCTEPSFLTSPLTHRFCKTEERAREAGLPQQHRESPLACPPSCFLPGTSTAHPALRPASAPRWSWPSGMETSGMAPGSHLPRAQGDQPGVLAEGALLHFVHELGQLGVRPAAVVNLPGEVGVGGDHHPKHSAQGGGPGPKRPREWGGRPGLRPKEGDHPSPPHPRQTPGDPCPGSRSASAPATLGSSVMSGEGVSPQW